MRMHTLLVRNCLKIWRWYTFSSMVPDVISRYTVTSLVCMGARVQGRQATRAPLCQAQAPAQGAGPSRAAAGPSGTSLGFRMEPYMEAETA